uniref:DUF2279 domain-containing protein n=1 Tax=uncultured bacterium pAM1 TaxID=1781153 RepID=A0A1C9U4V8_9BACT|nr:hypothetical protein [uncultured bacterium pAM1]
MKNALLLFIMTAQLSAAQAVQDSMVNTSEKNTAVTYGLVAYSGATVYLQYHWWWEGNYHAFRSENDGFWDNYSLGVDKVGHFYTSYLYFSVAHEFFRWADYDEETSMWLAILFPAFHALSIEIGDGFSTYAYSNVDLVANSLGIGYGILQTKIPFFNNFTFKWSYYPSGIIPFDGRFRITDDYDGHIYWLSADIYQLLPASMQEYYPRWLSIAVGYGGKNISGRPSWIGTPISSPGRPERKWAVSFDYNLMELPMEGGLWNPVKTLLNRFKFPAPGVRKTQGGTEEFVPVILH